MARVPKISTLMVFIERKAEEAAHNPGSQHEVEMYLAVFEELARLEDLER